MNVTQDPRCPQHPQLEANATWRAYSTHLYPVWTCAACHRPIGLASLHPGFDVPLRFPAPRQAIPFDRSLNKVDWTWLGRRGGTL